MLIAGHIVESSKYNKLQYSYLLINKLGKRSILKTVASQDQIMEE